MKNLVIGNTSQLSHYFPDDYEKISSRDINFTDEQYDSVYLCFGEQRIHKNDRDLFFDVHVDQTIKVLKHYTEHSNRVVLYGTSELWNNYNGTIDLKTTYNYLSEPYADSKRIMVEIVNKLFPKVIILHPFNYCSINTHDDFLIKKVIDSIINEEKITITEDTHYYTELLHPKFVVEESIKAKTSGIIGSGRLIYLNDLIKTLYTYFSLDYNDFVVEEYETKERNIFYLKSNQILYNNLYNDIIREIENYRPLKNV